MIRVEVEDYNVNIKEDGRLLMWTNCGDQEGLDRELKILEQLSEQEIRDLADRKIKVYFQGIFLVIKRIK